MLAFRTDIGCQFGGSESQRMNALAASTCGACLKITQAPVRRKRSRLQFCQIAFFSEKGRIRVKLSTNAPSGIASPDAAFQSVTKEGDGSEVLSIANCGKS